MIELAWLALGWSLIGGLGSPSFSIRERSSSALMILGESAWPWLEAGEESSDVEVTARCRQVLVFGLHRRTAAWLEVRETAGPWPWIDMHPNPGRINAMYWVDEARKQGVVGGGPEWPAHRLATRLYVEALLTKRQSVEEVEDMLTQMAANEVAWKKGGGR